MVRNLEVIGEAVGKLPKRIVAEAPVVEWRKISGMRNILTHEYFGVDNTIVWQVVKEKLPTLGRAVSNILANI